MSQIPALTDHEQFVLGNMLAAYTKYLKKQSTMPLSTKALALADATRLVARLIPDS